jgi:hypothetical protein
LVLLTYDAAAASAKLEKAVEKRRGSSEPSIAPWKESAYILSAGIGRKSSGTVARAGGGAGDDVGDDVGDRDVAATVDVVVAAADVGVGLDVLVPAMRANDSEAVVVAISSPRSFSGRQGKRSRLPVLCSM